MLQEVSVVVWHRCPRAQTVAAALAAGLRSDQEAQDVFLGRATLPLSSLLSAQA